jgi:hypothetical protein
LAVFVATFTLFLFWYNDRYRMDPVQELDLPVEDARAEVLLATQGSAYKDAVTDGLATQLRAEQVHVRIIDVGQLPAVDPTNWDAVVVLHTWEMWEPEPHAAAFVARYPDRANIIVLSTSGSGDMRLDSVDGISSASAVADVPTDVERLMEALRRHIRR